jgi:predicted transcriptional regulator of viral defense system
MHFESIDALATAQHGLVSYRQLSENGLALAGLTRLLERGQLRRLQPTVYRLAGAPNTWQQQVMSACLSTDGVASHRTAAALRGLDTFAPGLVEVTTERWKRRHRTFTVHEAKDLVGGDFDVVDGIPCTSLVRTLLDLPQVVGLAQGGAALDHARRRQSDILVPVKHRFVEVARRGRPGTRKMRLLLNERLAEKLAPDSRFERKALLLVRNGGLPEPELQYEVRFDDGSRAFLDLAWPAHRIGVECDSLAYHFGERAFQRDRARRRKLQLAGWDVFEFTYDEVTRHGPIVLAELRTALAIPNRRS